MFDPEKVRNYTLSGIQHEPAGQHYVKASDYDKLLVRYRAVAGPNVINALKLGQHDPQTS